MSSPQVKAILDDAVKAAADHCPDCEIINRTHKKIYDRVGRVIINEIDRLIKEESPVMVANMVHASIMSSLTAAMMFSPDRERGAQTLTEMLEDMKDLVKDSAADPRADFWGSML